MMRARFAPSPTGYLHIGGSRTALFSWLYARANQGEFILRIEDTDKARSQKIYLDEILDSLTWLGINWDKLFYQSERFSLYKEFAEKLVKAEKAYVEENSAIVFKVNPRKIKIQDLIHGEIEFDTSVIKDQVLIKGDGTPTYNFACVVDDATMMITHVVRGDDHISNTPKQILIYEALGFNLPSFAHIPLILGAQGGRLSKRTGATSISDYRRCGFLSEAVVNYLMLLGWSPGKDKEVISIKEAVKLFDIKAVNKTAAAFNLDKLKWLNSLYIKNSPKEKLLGLLLPLLLEKKFIRSEKDCDRKWILDLIELYKARIFTLLDFVDWADFFFLEEVRFEEGAKEKFLKTDLSKEFKNLIERFDKLRSFNTKTIEEDFRKLCQELNVPTRKLIHPIRVAITGKTIGAGLFEVMSLLGKEKVKKRLLRAVKSMESDKI